MLSNKIKHILEATLTDKVDILRHLKDAEASVDTKPSEAAIEAGNYKKGHINIHGFDITIEQPKGSIRSGKDKNGKEWSIKMNNTYGYFKNTLGKDGDHIDVFLGDKFHSKKVFPVDQYLDGKFDETKVMLFFDTKEEARKAYLSNYRKGWKGLKYISEVDIEIFKEWLYDNQKQKQPFNFYKNLAENHTKDKIELPPIHIGDEIKIGKWKNKKVRIKDSYLDSKNQPKIKTDKGDKKIFNFDIVDESMVYGHVSKGSAAPENDKFEIGFEHPSPIEKYDIIGEELLDKNNLVPITKKPSILYHKSNPLFRKQIANSGLLPQKGDSYTMHYEEDAPPAIFMYGGKVDSYDSTYNDDIWQINPKGVDMLYLDPSFNGDKFITFNKINREYIKLISKGDGLSENTEVDLIKSNAISNNTHLLAPNGKPSNLNEKQWVLVRTKAFKNWFGEWESNDYYGDFSKMLDENGEPKLFYHRSPHNFKSFDISKHGSNTDAGWLGVGAYFYGVKEESYGYGDVSYTCFLNIREPYYIESDEYQNLVDSNNIEVSTEFTDNVKSDGYDGVYWNGDLREEVVAFYPNQIKSATANNITFSANSQNIEESEDGLITEVEPEDVSLSSFKIENSLHPKLFPNNKLNSKVRLKLLDVADDFIEYLNVPWVKPEDIVLVGSSIGYNHNKYSDVDLHVIMDLSKIDDNTELAREYVDSKKNLWNAQHNNLKIYGMPVEVYVEDVKNPAKSNGRYSIETNDWIDEPIKNPPIQLEKYEIKRKSAQIMSKIDDLGERLNLSTDSFNKRKVYEDAKKLWAYIKSMRKTSLENSGEMSIGNIVFKVLRRVEYLQKLSDIINKSYDLMYTLPENSSLGRYKTLLINELSQKL